jgi:hypothetical protein
MIEENKINEQVMPFDVVIEDSPFDFLNEEVLSKPAYTVRRLTAYGTKRFYFVSNMDGVTVYASGTTMISDGYPEDNRFLEEWRIKQRLMGKDPDEVAAYRADYGTILHVFYGEFFKGNVIDLSNLMNSLQDVDFRMSEERVRQIVSENTREFQKDILSLVAWVKDYNVKPLAVELMLKSDGMMVATAIDLICEIDLEVKGFWGEVYKSGAKKGQARETKKVLRVPAVVDFKSGKKGFYDKHALQLGINKRLVEEEYPELGEVRIFNFSPKDWKTTPSYNFKEQTDNPVLEYLDDVISIGRRRHLGKSKEISSIQGEVSFSGENLFEDNYVTKDLNELLNVNRESQT